MGLKITHSFLPRCVTDEWASLFSTADNNIFGLLAMMRLINLVRKAPPVTQVLSPAILSILFFSILH